MSAALSVIAVVFACTVFAVFVQVVDAHAPHSQVQQYR